MPVGTIGTDRSGGSWGGRGMGGGTGLSRGLRDLRTRAGITNSAGVDLGRIGGGQGPGSANAGIGTYAQDRQGLNAAYGGPVDDTGFLGRLLGYRTYNNPISNQYAGTSVDMGSILGGLGGLALGMPGLGMLGGLLSPEGMNVGFGPEMGAWRSGGQAGTGAQGVGTGRGAPYGFGMRGPAAQPGVSAAPASSGAPPGTYNPLSFGGAMQNPQANYGLLPGYSANTRFGQGVLGGMGWGG